MIDIDDDALARALRTVEVGGYASVEQLRARAHQVRARRRLAVAGGAAAATAAAAVAVLLPNVVPDGAEPPTVDRPSVEEPALQVPDVVLDLDTLGNGPEPTVPWYLPVGGAVYVGSDESVIIADSDHAEVHQVAGGVVVWDTPRPEESPDRSLTFFPAGGGDNVVLASGGQISSPVVSPDGTRIAWGIGNPDWADDTSGRPDTDFTSALVVADAATGEVLEELPGAPAPHTRPMGFLDDGTVLVEAAANTTWGLYTWDLGEGLTPYRDGVAVDAVSPAGDLLALTAADGGSDIVDVASGATLWTLRGGAPLVFSPDGRYLAVLARPVPAWLTPDDLATARPGDILSEDGHEVTVTQDLLDTAARYPDGWEGVSHVVIVDARTGAEVLRAEGELYELKVAWESGTSVVFDAYQDSAEAALVRCSTGGGCELATEPAGLDDDPDTYDIPYLLAR